VLELSLDEIQELKDRCGSLEQAAIDALLDPYYAQEFLATGTRLYQRRDGSYGYLFPPRPEKQAFFWRLVLATHRRRSEQKKVQVDLAGNGYTEDEIKAANALLEREGRLVARRLEAEAAMSLRRALRFWHWYEAGAVLWSQEHGLRPGRGFKWVKRKTRSGYRFTLARN
jgi:hypothetical protein